MKGMPGCPQGRTSSRMRWSESDWSIEITHTGLWASVWFHSRHEEVGLDLHKCIPQGLAFISSSGECNISIWNLRDPQGFAGQTSLCPDAVD